MALPALGETAAHLPWLSPAVASLTALARSPTCWEALRADPGAVLLLLRHAPVVLAPTEPLFPALLRDAAVLDEAARRLDEPAFVDWNHPAIQPIYQAALAYASAARGFADEFHLDPELAWAAGLLAPLGWFAACAVDPAAVAFVRDDSQFWQVPSTVQRCHWGIDAASIARRLSRRWRLPPWLGAIVGHLALPVDLAQAVGADTALFPLVQRAVALVEHRQPLLVLPVGVHPSALDGISSPAPSAPNEIAEIDRTLPNAVPLLRDLLLIAAENRRLTAAPVLDRLEADVDHLHGALEEQRESETARLQGQKLATLAEFAAGAGHEINNPLAVISGQAQYLLGHEADPGHQRALHTIIAQTQRIHDLLTELMQFARPSRPQKRPVDLSGLLREVTSALFDLAAMRQVRLECPELEHPIEMLADPRQLRTALTALLRNAIEAAPAEGWAGIRVRTPTPDRVDLLVEDNGRGPSPAQLEHLFDPFFSGRQAGRGRGLGLPTAWRLAREHGGNVYFDDLSPGLTRFVLTLPLETPSHARSA